MENLSIPLTDLLVVRLTYILASDPGWIAEARLSWLLNTPPPHAAARNARPNTSKPFANLGCIPLCHRRLAKATK